MNVNDVLSKAGGGVGSRSWSCSTMGQRETEESELKHWASWSDYWVFTWRTVIYNLNKSRLVRIVWLNQVREPKIKFSIRALGFDSEGVTSPHTLWWLIDWRLKGWKRKKVWGWWGLEWPYDVVIQRRVCHFFLKITASSDQNSNSISVCCFCWTPLVHSLSGGE